MHESSVITSSNNDQISARQELFNLLGHYPASPEEMERSLSLFLRGSMLARILGIFEVYQHIVKIPGAILDIGTWRGQTAVLCENFRAILEPLNFQRRIHAFDTFTGYQGFANESRKEEVLSDGTYSLPKNYADLLAKLLQLHERNNAMGHIHDKHHVWEGDCRETLKDFEKQYPSEMIALAWFDVNAMQPTQYAFETVLKHLVPGGIIAIWQLSRGNEIPAEGTYYLNEVLKQYPHHQIYHSQAYPSLCYLVFP